MTDKSKKQQESGSSRPIVVGDIVRYNSITSTALMRITYIHTEWDDSRFETITYFGQHYFGGLVRARADNCLLATYIEVQAWHNEGRRKGRDGKLLRVPWVMFSAKFNNAKACGVKDEDKG